MKRARKVLIGLAVICTLLFDKSSNFKAAHAQNFEDDILVNGDFESLSEGWTTVSDEMGKLGFDDALSYAYSGVRNFYLDSTGINPNEERGIYQDVRVTGNTWYKLSFYAKLWAPDNYQPILNYGFFDAFNDAFSFKISIESEKLSATTYTCFTSMFYSSSFAKIRVGLYLNPYSENNMGLHLDAFSLRPMKDLSSVKFSVEDKTYEEGDEILYSVKGKYSGAIEFTELPKGFEKAYTFSSNIPAGSKLEKGKLYCLSGEHNLTLNVINNGGNSLSFTIPLKVYPSGTSMLFETELVNNGSFETSDTSWGFLNNVGIDSNNTGYKGTKNAYIKATVETSEQVGLKSGLYTTVGLEVNSWYKVTFFARKWGEGNIVPPINVSLSKFGNDFDYFEVSPATQIYTRYEGLLYSGEQTTCELNIFVNSISKETAHNYDTGYHIDYVSLRKTNAISSITLNELSSNPYVGEKLNLTGKVSFTNGVTDYPFLTWMMRLLSLELNNVCELKKDGVYAKNTGTYSLILKANDITSNAINVEITNNQIADVDAPNLLLNGGFETSEFEYNSAIAFTGWNATDNDIGIDKGSGYQREGHSNLWLRSWSESGNLIRGIFQPISTEKNTWYKFVYFAKKWGVGNQVAPLEAIAFTGTNPRQNIIKCEKFFLDYVPYYECATMYFNSGENTSINVGIYINTYSYGKTNYFDTGYHIDSVSLRRTSNVNSCDFVVNKAPVIGEALAYSPSVLVDNIFSNLNIESHELANISFVTSDATIFECDGKYVTALKEGSAELEMHVNYGGVELISEAKSVTVIAGTEERTPRTFITGISENVTTTSYSKVNTSLKDVNGKNIGTKNADIKVYSSSDNIILYENAGVYFVMGKGNGVAHLDVELRMDGYYFYQGLDVEINDGNYLQDSSFEDNTKSCWTIESDLSTGYDTGAANTLARTGKNNIFFAAPVYQKADAPKDATGYLYQDVTLDIEQEYTITAHIARFFAPTQFSYGGVVSIGIYKLQNGEVVESSYTKTDYGTNYGVNGYQAITHTFNGCPGDYRVMILVKGNPTYGVGLQIDDVTLKKSNFPIRFEVEVGYENEIYVDDTEAIYLRFYFEDGTYTEEGFTKISYSISDSSIAYIYNGYIVGKKAGTFDLTVKATYLGKEYEKKTTIKVISEDEENEQTNKKVSPLVYVGIAGGGGLAVIGVLLFFLRHRNKK